MNCQFTRKLQIKKCSGNSNGKSLCCDYYIHSTSQLIIIMLTALVNLKLVMPEESDKKNNLLFKKMLKFKYNSYEYF